MPPQSPNPRPALYSASASSTGTLPGTVLPPSVHAHHRHVLHALGRIHVHREEVPANAIEALGDGASSTGDVGGDARVRERVERVHVAVERQIDPRPSQL